jgi:hypothetical protein
MKKELQEKLFNDYPQLFELRKDPALYPIVFGIECGDGWFDLINDLCKKIVEIDPNVKATQVKEKFAGLRFYTTGTLDAVWDLIEEAEDKSYKICEDCGAPGTLRGNMWVSTLCDSCWEKVNK